MAHRRRGSSRDLLHIHVQICAQQKADLIALAQANKITLGATVELLIVKEIRRRAAAAK